MPDRRAPAPDRQTVTFHGTFFDLVEAAISPAPATPVPIVVGGRSDAAIRRSGWHSVKRPLTKPFRNDA